MAVVTGKGQSVGALVRYFWVVWEVRSPDAVENHSASLLMLNTRQSKNQNASYS
jgi:hypothetical protein